MRSYTTYGVLLRDLPYALLFGSFKGAGIYLQLHMASVSGSKMISSKAPNNIHVAFLFWFKVYSLIKGFSKN